MRRRLTALLVMTVLLGFSWPPLFSSRESEAECSCGCRTDGRACRCCLPPPNRDLGRPPVKFQAVVRANAHKCPCTAAGLQPLFGFKIQAVLKDRLLIEVSGAHGLRALSRDHALPDNSLPSEQERAPPV